MQLDRLVRFHKAVADPTRIRILAILAKGPLHGQALAERLGVTPPTVTHHMAKLREAGLVYERREKNTVTFWLNEKNLKRYAQSILQVILKEQPEYGWGRGKVEELQVDEKEREAVIRHFFTEDGRLKQIPAQRKKKRIVFAHMLRGLELGRAYSEKEINEHIKQFHEDFATIRREFVMNHFMYRENGIYELNPPDLWKTGEED